MCIMVTLVLLNLPMYYFYYHYIVLFYTIFAILKNGRSSGKLVSET